MNQLYNLPSVVCRGSEMSTYHTGRRNFLRLAGASIAGTGLQSLAVQAQTTPVGGSSSVYDVKSFGANGDGKTIDSLAINRAIDTAVAAGGGTVRLPAGNYVCYSIRLKSNVALYLEQGATIIAADPPSSGSGGYDLAEPKTPWDAYQDFGHNHWHNSLIWGEGLVDLSILGPGLIWGRGLSRGYGGGLPPRIRALPTKQSP
jgi:polygalacturonase